MPIVNTLSPKHNFLNDLVDFVGDDNNPLVVITPAPKEAVRFLFAKCVNLVHVREYRCSVEEFTMDHPSAEVLSNDPLDPCWKTFFQHGFEWFDIVSKGRSINDVRGPEDIDIMNMTTDDRNTFLNPHGIWQRFILGLCDIRADVDKIVITEGHVVEFDFEYLMVNSAEFRDVFVREALQALRLWGKRPSGLEPVSLHQLYSVNELDRICDDIDPQDSIDAFHSFVGSLPTFTKESEPIRLEWDGEHAALDRFTSVFNDEVRLSAKKIVSGHLASVVEVFNECHSSVKAMKWECNIFPASALVALFKFLKDVHGVEVKRMFDPFAGWGDRLFASVLSGVEYVGNDANMEMGSVYMSIMFALSALNVDKFPPNTHSISGKRIEDLVIQDKMKDSFDLVFTSPPYFCLEQYGSGDTAVDVSSMCREMIVSEYKSWMSSFGDAFITKSVQVLRSGGILGIHLSDFSINGVGFQFKNDFTRLCEMKGLEKLDPWGYNFSSDKRKVREFLLFKKH